MQISGPKTKPAFFGSQVIGEQPFVVIAGPCSIESEEHLHQVANFVGTHGAVALRGGIFKLRTQPTTFQGLGRDAYDIVKKVKNETHLPFVSEVTDPRQIEDLIEVVDAFQVGSRNMHNYALLKELGRTNKPVLLKRGFAALIKEWLYAADYLLKEGNDRIVLCERGIRTFETATRNTFDLNAIAYIKQHSPYPVIADPSHGTGHSSLVTPLALAAAAAGADGLLIEVHPDPARAKSDGYQTLNYAQFDDLMERLKKILHALDRPLAVRTLQPASDGMTYGEPHHEPELNA